MTTRSVVCTMPLAAASHLPVLHVEGDAEVLADHHARASSPRPRSPGRPAARPPRWPGGSPSSSTTTTRPSGAARPSSTSTTSTTRARVRRRPPRAGAGTAPVATTTASGLRASDARRRRPRRRARRRPRARWHSAAGCARCRRARPGSARWRRPATCPPACALALEQRHGWPRCGGGDGRLQARPARRPPTTHPPADPATSAAGRRDSDLRGRCGGSRCSPSQRLRPMRPTHSWLHDRHSRMSSASPGAGLGGEVGVGDLAAHHADQVGRGPRPAPARPAAGP